MKLSDIEDADKLVTKEYLEAKLGDFKAQMLKEFGDFRADLMKTIWLTQLSTIGIVLIGVGLLIHFHL